MAIEHRQEALGIGGIAGLDDDIEDQAEYGGALSTPSDDPIEVLIAHAQSLGEAWSRYAALSQTLYPGRPVAEMARKRLDAETGEQIIGPDHWMFEIELAIIEDFCISAPQALGTGLR